MSFLSFLFIAERRAVAEMKQLVLDSMRQTDEALANARAMAELVETSQDNFDRIQAAMCFWENRCAELETKLALEKASR